MTKKKNKYGYVRDYWKGFSLYTSHEGIAYFIANSIGYSIQDNGLNTNDQASTDLYDLQRGIMQLITPILKQYEKDIKEKVRKKEKLA